MKALCSLGREPRPPAAIVPQQRRVPLGEAVGEASLFPSCGLSASVPLARIGLIVVASIGLATACAPVEPPVVAPHHEPATSLVSTRPTPIAAPPGSKLGELIDSAPKSGAGGDRLNVDLLRRFYARHGFAPVWTSRPAQAEALINAVSRAGDHGLDPELFQASKLRSPATLPELDRELLLSNAFLTSAAALARGVMPVERRRDDEVLAPEPIDVAAALDAALGSADPAAALEALAPTTANYRLLRQALKDGRAGNGATPRLRDIEVNLERERWLPRRLPGDRVWVNVADQRLLLYRDDRVVFSTRVIVGQSERRNQSPEFQVPIDAILFNPPWNIPDDITNEEILPKARNDPGYLARHNLVPLPDGGLQQLAGPNSALGQLMFEMNNRFDVYLHDTPSKNLFSRDDRRISHGCIRVENPQQLAALLMQQPIDAIHQVIATSGTARRALPKPVPVFVVYQTAFAEFDGRLQFRADSYARDAEVWRALTPKGRALAQR